MPDDGPVLPNGISLFILASRLMVFVELSYLLPKAATALGPVGPVHPIKSVKSNKNTENKGIEAHSKYTFLVQKPKRSYVFCENSIKLATF